MASCERVSGTPNIHKYLCTNATATEFYAGDLVRLDGSGTLTIATDASATASAGILGIAMEGNPASATTYIPVDVISSDGSMFMMHSTETAASSELGEQHAITLTAGAHTIASGSGAFIALDYLDPIGTATPRIVGKFLPARLQSEVGW